MTIGENLNFLGRILLGVLNVYCLYKGRNIFKKVQAICFFWLCVSCDKFNFGVFKKTTLLLRVHLQGLQLQNKVLQKSHSIQ
ncbi:hypothetical protein UA3_01221 [Enterococcus faecium EnGen0263]|nr:hypothetical protein UA3_01221 [Enterococcus faecium EnGen0263]